MTLTSAQASGILTEDQINTYAKTATDWSIRLAPSHIRRDDLLQEARIAIWQASQRWDSERGGALRSWVLLRAYGACLDAIRRVPDPQVFVVLDFDAIIAKTREPDPDIEDAIRKLPTEARTVITLLFFTGFTCDEAARVLRVSPTLVKRRRDLALSRLRIILDRID